MDSGTGEIHASAEGWNREANVLYIEQPAGVGESYAGIYVPYLSNAIYDHNQAANDDDFKPPLKGFMVGNGVTNWTYDTNTAYLDMAYWHSIMSTELHDKITADECDFSGPNMSKASKKCLAHLVEFDRSVSD